MTSKQLMKISTPLRRNVLAWSGAAVFGLGLLTAAALRADDQMVPLTPKLPAPAFVGTPKDTVPNSNVEPISDKPRPPMMVPKDVVNLAPGKKITCSDANAQPDALAKLTDGNKEAAEASITLLRKGLQWVQFDLDQDNEIFAILLWHAHDSAKIYRQVVVQISDDPEFKNDVKTVFNNDAANDSKLGAGTDRQYYETYEGKLIPVKALKGRYVRFYSHGSTDSAMNEYTEVEIYGRPAK
jgi:hypothetical protein